ncbi:hypothetical protein BLNAU_16478 [Blattamonas nauphoetae]|uniref:Uncharacterized protein n=1 Tax=Blattamonas nauphoetae TaxID=2049346 RepID=A0ABQ9XCJ7_9EUKA|nr:hypothetical protein BLNAU_16478 [Blattamonas nauphoetae]
MDLTLPRDAFNSIQSFLLTLLVLSAASTNDELSNAAVSVFSNQFSLSTPQTKALLFATPPIFPLNDVFSPQHHQVSRDSDRRNRPSQSICHKAGRCVMLKSRSDHSIPKLRFSIRRTLGIPFAGCLVNALHSITTLPHSFPFFSPELCRLSQQPSVWNDPSQPSALVGLTTLADIEIRLAFHRYPKELSVELVDQERRDTVCVHLFPFLKTDSQIQFLSSFNTFYRTKNTHGSLDRMVECLVEMATVKSYNTPIALLTEMHKTAKILTSINPRRPSLGPPISRASPFEMSIVERLRTAEGEGRWKLLTQLAVVSTNIPNVANELIQAENDTQALFLLSIHRIRSTPTLDLHLASNPAAFDRVVEVVGHFNNLPLVSVALEHIGKTVETHILPPSAPRLFNIQPKREMCELVLSTLRGMAVCRRGGMEEGCVVGRDEMTSQIVNSCLQIFRVLMSAESFDPTPFVDSLVSLAVTTDPSLLRSILLDLQQIEVRTQNTPTPFSISRATAPFRGIHQSSVTKQPLSSIVASILLTSILHPQQTLSPRNDFVLSSEFHRMNEKLISDIAKETTEIVCLILEKGSAAFSRTQTSNDSSHSTRTNPLAQKDRLPTPQQLFLILCKMILPDDPADISSSTLISLAPFLARILTIVVPSSPDRIEIPFLRDEHSQNLNSFVFLFLSLFNTGTPSTLSTPPHSPLLSVLSIALIRLDAIPSSLDLYPKFCDMFKKRKNRSNPLVRQIVYTLSEEGLEDRCHLALDQLSMTVLNKWKGANARRPAVLQILSRINLNNGFIVAPSRDESHDFDCFDHLIDEHFFTQYLHTQDHRFQNTSSTQKTHELTIGGQLPTDKPVLHGHGTFVLEGSSHMHLTVTLRLSILSDRTPVGTNEQRPYLIKILSEATLTGEIVLNNPLYPSLKEYEALNVSSHCFDETTETGAVVHVDKGEIDSLEVLNNDPDLLVYDFIDLSAYSQTNPLTLTAYVDFGTLDAYAMYNLINKGVTFRFTPPGGSLTTSTSSIQREPDWKSMVPTVFGIRTEKGKLTVQFYTSSNQLFHCAKDKFKVFVSPRCYDQEIEMNTNFKQLEYQKTYLQIESLNYLPYAYLLDTTDLSYSLPVDSKTNAEFLDVNWVTVKIEGPEETFFTEHMVIKSEI